MLSFFTLENRKRNTKKVCDGIYEFIKDIPYILFIFISVHAIFTIVIAYGIIFTKIHSKFFIISFLCLIIQITTNLYFKGCFLTKIERKMLGKKWYGFPYTQMFKNPSTVKVNVVFGTSILSMFMIAIIRIIINYKSP